MASSRSFLTLLLGGLLAAAAGCTGMAKAMAGRPVPAFGITEEAASAAGCQLDEIKLQGERHQRESYDAGGPGYVVPSVGDSVCDVFAKLGAPDDVQTITTEFGGAVHFQYSTGTTSQRNLKAHLVVLGENDSGTQMVVTSVVW